MDGTATLFMYELKEMPQEPSSTFVTKEEFDKVISQLKSLLPSAPTEEFKFQ
jgi:hypothetical protein